MLAEGRHAGGTIVDTSVLPYPKSTILNAFLAEISRATDPQHVEALKTMALYLADYQDGVGPAPLMDPAGHTTADMTKMNEQQFMKVAKSASMDQTGERWLRFSQQASAEQIEILTKIEAPTQRR